MTSSPRARARVNLYFKVYIHVHVHFVAPSPTFWKFGSSPLQTHYVYTALGCNKYNLHSCLTFHFTLLFRDLDEEIAQISLNAPYIMVMEASEATTYDVIVEKSSLFQSTDLRTALVDLFSAYFVFDIAYPPELYPIFLSTLCAWIEGQTKSPCFCNNDCWNNVPTGLNKDLYYDYF